MNLDDFTNIALSAFGELPAPVKQNLNLGITVIPDAKANKDGLTYILGEYYTDSMMGRGIRLFYGSFMATMGHLPKKLLVREIIKTVKHEVRHHVELSAGVDYLGAEDRIKITRLRKRFGLIRDDMITKAFTSRFLSAILVVVLMLILILFLLSKFSG